MAAVANSVLPVDDKHETLCYRSDMTVRPQQDPDNDAIRAAYSSISATLLAERTDDGRWEGHLSTSALSTATAVMALSMANTAARDESEASRFCELVQAGLKWLAEHQNDDGGWGDTVLSVSNISTTMLANAVFHATKQAVQYQDVVQASQQYIDDAGGVDAVLKRYGKDKTFSVPILTHCALAGVVDWQHVIPLPFELSCIPSSFYAAVRLPVVSYALPALIAIGQVVFKKRGHWNPIVRGIRTAAIKRSMRVLQSIQPEHGGFLEATPLTSFVCMSLLGCDFHDHPVTNRCLDFIVASVRPDGSWPIDTNLSTWVTTLSVNALSGEGMASSDQGDATALKPEDRQRIRSWLLAQQYKVVHPYTDSPPGGWSWTDLPGGVPDADDTPGAMLAILNLRQNGQPYLTEELSALQNAATWLLNLQNRDGGWPTFCRGWGALPFDRSSNDLTAHVLRAMTLWQSRVADISGEYTARSDSAVQRGLRFLSRTQADDGSWLPLWFGNQFNHNDENPLYGTAKVVLALQEIGRGEEPYSVRGVQWLISNQNDDGGWSGRKGLPSSTEETALAVEALAGVPDADSAVISGANWLVGKVQDGSVADPSPIGFYFAKLWYFERLYPIIFATGALQRCLHARNPR
ncbi:MAG: squalene--hopene cyclase [Fuerstiella sp.]|nr:squalene--hopene cyclase [Fuerstiella sp.]MCP4853188.1 squalene--hopene cyclase [Fuerstiella sp.]